MLRANIWLRGLDTTFTELAIVFSEVRFWEISRRKLDVRQISTPNPEPTPLQTDHKEFSVIKKYGAPDSLKVQVGMG